MMQSERPLPEVQIDDTLERLVGEPGNEKDELATSSEDEVLEAVVVNKDINGGSVVGGYPIDIENDLSRIRESLWVGLGYWKRWIETRSEMDRARAVDYLLAFRGEVFKNEKRLKQPEQTSIGIWINNLECDTGVIQDINPNRYYEKSETKYILKKLGRREAHQNHQDWLTYFAPEASLNLTNLGVQSAEILREPLPINDKDAFILQEDLIGPSSASVLFTLNKHYPDDPRAAEIRDTIISHRIHEYMTWRDRVPTLTSQGKYTVAKVVDGYIRRWMDFFQNFGKNIGVTLPKNQIETAQEAINSFPWSEIIQENTLMRYFSGTFRNSILKTNKLNISANELIERFSRDGKVDVDVIKENMYTIDHSDRDVHHLEDVWEILNNFYARLSKDKKLELYDEIRRTDKCDVPPEPYMDQGALVMHMFRNCRTAALFMNKYWPKMVEKNRKGIMSDQEFQNHKQLYVNILQEQIYQAMEMNLQLNKVAPNSPLTKLMKPLESGYKIIA